MPDMDALRAWVSYDDDKKNAAAMEKRAKARCNELEPQILESLVQDGADSIRVTLEALDIDKEARETAHEALNALATDPPFIGFNIGDGGDEIVSAIVDALRSEGLLKDNQPEIVKTVFIGSRVWAKPVPTGTDDNGDPKATDEDYERACIALAREGWEQFVQTRFNVISLSSAVKEEVGKTIFFEDGESSTLAFDGTIIVEDRPQLNARKAPAKKAT
jgi:hypothetical protein